MFGLTVTPYGVLETVNLRGDDAAFLSRLQSAIDCRTVERVHVPGADVWVDEDGRAMGARYNRFASVLAGQAIVGTAVVTRRRADDRIAPPAPAFIRSFAEYVENGGGLVEADVWDCAS